MQPHIDPNLIEAINCGDCVAIEPRVGPGAGSHERALHHGIHTPFEVVAELV